MSIIGVKETRSCPRRDVERWASGDFMSIQDRAGEER